MCLLYDNIFGKYYKRVLSWVAIDSRYDGTHACKLDITYNYKYNGKMLQDEFQPRLQALIYFSGTNGINVNNRQIANTFNRKRVCCLW